MKFVLRETFLLSQFPCNYKLNYPNLGKKCTGMYPLQSQKEVVRDLTGNDLIIVSSIAGGYWQDHPDMLREIAKSRAHKICITQVENIPYQEQFDMLIQVGTDHLFFDW